MGERQRQAEGKAKEERNQSKRLRPPAQPRQRSDTAGRSSLGGNAGALKQKEGVTMNSFRSVASSPGGAAFSLGAACSSCGACSVLLSSAGLCWACAPRCPVCGLPLGFPVGLRGACSCPPPLPPLPPARSVAFSAFRAGSLASVALRPASWSSSVLVGVFGFRSPSAAGAFAARWAARLGVSVPVRRSGALWAVAVPVAGVPSGSRAGLWVRGGLRGLLRALRALASASPALLRLAGGVSSNV